VPAEDSDLAPGNPASRAEAIDSVSLDLLKVAHAALNEDLALGLLKRSDLAPEVLDELSKNSAVMKSRNVKLGIVAHPKTPRYISISLLRQLFTFDLMKVALTSVISGDIKAAAEEALIKRLESLSSGERMSLARRASGRVAAALLLDREKRVIHMALENPRLTEAMVVKCLMQSGSSVALVRAACDHPKWSLRRDIRIALLRNEKTPIRYVEEFARAFSNAQLEEILGRSRFSDAAKKTSLNQR